MHRLMHAKECQQFGYPECANSEIFCLISLATQKSQVGAAYILSTGASCAIPLGTCVDETQVSVYALLDVCNLLSNSNLNGDSITIFMDSKSSVQSLASDWKVSSLTRECFLALENLSRAKSLRLCWVPRLFDLYDSQITDLPA